MDGSGNPLTLVPGSLKVEGGDQNVNSGLYTVAYCTATMGYLPGECTANINTGNFKTTYPYIETFLNVSSEVTGGDALVLPTISAEWTVPSGEATGQTFNDYETEFVASTLIKNAGGQTATPDLDGYPTNDCTASTAPLHHRALRGAVGPLVGRDRSSTDGYRGQPELGQPPARA